MHALPKTLYEILSIQGQSYRIKSIPDIKAITNLKIFNKMSTGKSMMSKYFEILFKRCDIILCISTIFTKVFLGLLHE